MDISIHVRCHHYNYDYPGEQPEGIRNRIRQGSGGPEYLEPGAQVYGHLHLPSNQRTQIGDEVIMKFRDQKWTVRLDHPPLCFCENGGMIIQNQPGITGHEVQGTCIKRIE